MSKTKLIIAAVLVIIVLLLILQNLNACSVRFLFWAGSLPVALMLFIALAIGFVIGIIAATTWLKSRDSM